MQTDKLKKFVQEIVAKANELKDKHTSEKDAKVNYACVFSQDESHYNVLLSAANQMGTVIEYTPTGPLFHIRPLETSAGILKLLKIRKPDATRPELGDADFTVKDYIKFKKEHIAKAGFSLIKRPNGEMIELVDQEFNVRAYFSSNPLDKALKV